MSIIIIVNAGKCPSGNVCLGPLFCYAWLTYKRLDSSLWQLNAANMDGERP
jgi:hypothetical protein